MAEMEVKRGRLEGSSQRMMHCGGGEACAGLGKIPTFPASAAHDDLLPQSRGADPSIKTEDYDPYLNPGKKLPVEVCVCGGGRTGLQSTSLTGFDACLAPHHSSLNEPTRLLLLPPPRRVCVRPMQCECVQVAIEDDAIRGKLLALEKRYAGVARRPEPHPDIGCWWALYDYGLEAVKAWPKAHKQPYPGAPPRSPPRLWVGVASGGRQQSINFMPCRLPMCRGAEAAARGG